MRDGAGGNTAAAAAGAVLGPASNPWRCGTGKTFACRQVRLDIGQCAEQPSGPITQPGVGLDRRCGVDLTLQAQTVPRSDKWNMGNARLHAIPGAEADWLLRRARMWNTFHDEETRSCL